MPRSGGKATKLAKRGQISPAKNKTLPFDLATQREMMMEAAGLTVEERAKLLKKAVGEQESALAAVLPAKKRTKTGPGGKGVTIEEGGAPDWSARLRAAEAIEDLVGATGKVTQTAASGPTQIVVAIADFAKPKQAEVIEVESGAGYINPSATSAT